MNRGIALALAGIILTTTPVMAEDNLLKQARDLFKPIPSDPPALKNNPSTPAKIELGAMLYFDPRLSEGHTISCNTCHRVGLGGVDMLETSIGHRWQKGGRNAPTVLNAVFNTAQFWDGRAADLEEQAGGPMANPVEMGSTHPHVIETLKKIPGYRPKFESAYPRDDEPITIGNVVKAIAVFEATLTTPDSAFDAYLGGNNHALNPEQKEGLQLFIDKGCAGCHNGVNIGGHSYAAFGVVEKPGPDLLPPDDKGRAAVTKAASDEFVYRVAPLRNIALTPPYFHSGKVWDLKEAVTIMGSAQLGAKLTDAEADKITAFLKTLTGEQPEVVYPLLPPSTADSPRPKP